MPYGEEVSGYVGAAIRRPVGVLMTAAAVVLMGVVCLRKLPTNLMPEVAYPSLTVRTELPGSAPEEVEKLLSEPIEQRLGVLNNLVSIRSISRAGASDVQLEFRWGTRMDQMVSEVREKLDQVGRPADAKRPLILRYDPTLDPMMTIGVAPPLPAVEARVTGFEGWSGRAQASGLMATLLRGKDWADVVEGRRARRRGGVYELRIALARGTDLKAAREALTAELAAAAEKAAQAAGQPSMTGQAPARFKVLGVRAVEPIETDLATLRRIAVDEIQRRLEPLKGVAAAEVQGGRVREIRVELREDALAARNMSVSQVAQRIRAENLNLAGGTVKDGQAQSLLRAMAEYEDLDQIRKTVVSVVDGTPVRLGEIATVSLAYKKQEVVTRVGGRQAVQLAIYKEATSNIVTVADEVRTLLHGSSSLQAALADRVHIEILSDSSRFIRLATGEVYTTAIYGGILAMLVLYLFLGSLPNTLIISLAIPLSVVAAFVPMQLAGVSLNVMSLGGLALGIGMLVDNSIVVLESIHRAREEGHDAESASYLGTTRVAGAVTASTLTTVAVFFPIAFVEGIAGQIFRDQALTVVASLLASLVVSIVFIPMLAARRMPSREGQYRVGSDWMTWHSWRRLRRDLAAHTGIAGLAYSDDLSGPRSRWSWLLWLLVPWDLAIAVLSFALELTGKCLSLLSLLVVGLVALGIKYGVMLISLLLWPLRTLVEGVMYLLDRLYPPVLRGALLRPLPMLLLVGLAVWSSQRLGGDLGSELIPEVHQGELLLHLELPVGTPLPETDRVVAGIERRLRALPQVEGLDARCGVERSATSDPGAGEHTALIRLRLAADRSTPADEAAVIRGCAEIAASVPELRYHVDRPTLLSLRNPLTVEIKTDDLDALARQTRAVTALLRAQESLADVRPSLKRGNPEFHLHYDRERLAKFNLDIRRVAEVVRDKVHGEAVTRVRWDGERIDLWLGLRPEDVSSRKALAAIRVDGGGQAVPKRLGEVARIVRERGPSEIRHIGQQRAAVVEARVVGLDLGRSAAALSTELAEIERTSGGDAQLTVAGQSAEMQASLASLMFALGLALFLVYVVMASQFESFVQPIVIMFTVPLALVGVVWALSYFGLPVSVLVLIGGIVLAGIVVNNAIVLVDAINQHIAAIAGPATREALLQAIVDGSRTRLRPVLMTTLTTVLGLIPLTGVLGQTTGAELRRPLAITIIAGLVSATLLTLIVVPTFYGWVALWRGRSEGIADETPAE